MVSNSHPQRWGGGSLEAWGVQHRRSTYCYCGTPLLLNCCRLYWCVCKYIHICSLRMCADLTAPFNLIISGRLASVGWGKRYWSTYYCHQPWQLLRLHMCCACGLFLLDSYAKQTFTSTIFHSLASQHEAKPSFAAFALSLVP